MKGELDTFSKILLRISVSKFVKLRKKLITGSKSLSNNGINSNVTFFPCYSSSEFMVRLDFDKFIIPFFLKKYRFEFLNKNLFLKLYTNPKCGLHKLYTFFKFWKIEKANSKNDSINFILLTNQEQLKFVNKII